MPVISRPIESWLLCKGFCCYAWTQLVDFLDALRPPFDPTRDEQAAPARLLPNLRSMRMDFVNFQADLLPSYPDPTGDLREIASSDLGGSLDELMLTGIPISPSGTDVSECLSGMVKLGGLLVESNASFVQGKTKLKPIPDRYFLASVLQSSYRPGKEPPLHDQCVAFYPHHNAAPGTVPIAPKEMGHPPPSLRKRKTLWKMVPDSRDAVTRSWKEFDDESGLQVEHLKRHIVYIWDRETDMPC